MTAQSKRGDAMQPYRAWEAPHEISATFGDGLDPERAYTGAPRPGAREVAYVRADLHLGAVDLLREIREPIEDVYQDSSNWKDLRKVRKSIDAFLDQHGGR